jgi:type VI secretion system protein ImpF
MSGSNRSTRLGAPFMYAFRDAHRARDAAKTVDLRDETGERVIAGRRASGRGIVSEPVLRREVSRDLEALLNTVCLNSTLKLDGLDHVKASILNYGIPDIVHRSFDEIGVNEIVEEIEVAIKRFEPRVAGRSIHVTRDQTLDPNELKVRFVVNAELIMSPENIPVEFVADVDVNSGKIQVGRI